MEDDEKERFIEKIIESHFPVNVPIIVHPSLTINEDDMKSLGLKLAEGLNNLKKDIENGKPVKQTIVRKMKVNGKSTFIHSTFTAPIQKSK